MRRTVAVFGLAMLLSIATFAEEKAKEKAFSNADVIALADAGLGDDLIIAKVRQAKTADFNLSTEGLVGLKKKHVSDKVVQAMMDWGKQLTPPAPTSAPPPQPTATADGPKEEPGRLARIKSRVKSAVKRESPEQEKAQEAEEKQQDAAAIGHEANDDCMKNFKKEGSFVTGYKFSTYADVPNANKSKAFDAVIANLAAGGWQLVSSSKDAGIISASQHVIGGEAKTVPYNVTIQEKNGGLHVVQTFQLGFGMAGGSGQVQKQFCDVVDLVRSQAQVAKPMTKNNDQSQSTGKKADTTRPCVTNFKDLGVYHYTDWAEMAGMSKGTAFDRVLARITMGGWQIGTVTKESGIITGSLTNDFGGGTIVKQTLNIAIKETASGIRIEGVLASSSGTYGLPPQIAKREFCGDFDAAQTP